MVKLNDGQVIVLRLVERGEELVVGDGVCTTGAPLDGTALPEAGRGREHREEYCLHLSKHYVRRPEKVQGINQDEQIRKQGVTSIVIHFMQKSYQEAVEEYPKLAKDDHMHCCQLGFDGLWYAGGPWGFHPECFEDSGSSPLAPLVLAAVGPGQASLLRHFAHAIDQVL